MPAAELEYIFDDAFSFGQGSPTGSRWLVQDAGDLGIPGIRVERVPIAGTDGELVYALYLAANDFILTGEYVGPLDEAFSDMHETWLAAFAARPDDAPLRWNWPGLGPKYINCKPVNRKFSQDRLLSLGYSQWSVQFLAGDPTIHDDV